jgi:hypothetical protein
MVWRTILIGVVLTALLFLAFSVWIAIGQYENGDATPSMVVIARQVLQSALFWLLAIVVFAVVYFATNR